MKNPAQEGINAAREENARRVKIEREWTGRGSAADAITFADSALIQAREMQKQLGEVIGYLEEGSLLAAVGTFDGMPRGVVELEVLLRLIQRAATR